MLLDDELRAMDLLESHISKTDGIEVVAAFTNPIEALQHIEDLKPDVIFSDIQMPELNGVHLTKILGNKLPVIFTTAYDNYALEWYELDIVDYLVKLINLEYYQHAVAKLKKRLIPFQPVVQQALLEHNHIFVKSEYKTLRINLCEIHYIREWQIM